MGLQEGCWGSKSHGALLALLHRSQAHNYLRGHSVVALCKVQQPLNWTKSKERRAWR